MRPGSGQAHCCLPRPRPRTQLPAMVEAWYMDEAADDPRLPHRAEPARPVGLEQLRRLGVLYWKVRGARAAAQAPLRPLRPRAPRLPASGPAEPGPVLTAHARRGRAGPPPPPRGAPRARCRDRGSGGGDRGSGVRDGGRGGGQRGRSETSQWEAGAL